MLHDYSLFFLPSFCLSSRLLCSSFNPPPFPEGGQQVLQPEFQRVEREPIVRERVSKHVIEEVHPVIEREREQVHVIKTTVPIKGE